MEIRNVELSPVTPFGDYGQVTVAINTDCRMEQLVNLMADLSARKEAIGTLDLRLTASNPKEKTIAVRLTVAGLVPPNLVPKRKEATF